MSRLEPTTSALIQSLYLVVVGAGIGFSMQVLVLIVQNTSNFEDLGVATSGVTFFRTIGSSFGAAIFGSLFVNFLNRRMGPALAASGAPASAVSSPGALHRQPHSVAAPIVAAYSESLTQVFLWAAPVALLGFVLALLLREVPLRDMHASTVDLGDAFGMPTTETPDQMLETAIARMLRGQPGMRLRSIAMRPDCRLDVAGVGGCYASTAIRRCTGRPGSPTWPTTCGYLSRSWSPPSRAWWRTVTRNARANRCG